MSVEALEVRDVPSTVTIATLADATEGGAAGSIQLTRTGDTSQTETAYWSIGGTATPMSDYQLLSGQATFDVGASTVTVSVPVVDDTVSESTETIIFTLMGGMGYTVGTPSAATVNIIDNDNVAPPPALLVNTPLDVVNANDTLTSLREAIIYANAQTGSSQQRITFSASLTNQTVWLDDELPEIEKNIFIDGQNKDPIIRRDDTQGSFRLLRVKAGAALELSHLTLSSGFVDQALAGGFGGGGAVWAKGNLTASYCTFIGNGVSSDVEFGAGGAIWCSGQTAANGLVIGLLELSNCTFSCNWAPYGGAVATGGDMQLTQITDSTFTQNFAGVTGGALYLTNHDETDQADSIAQLYHCTIDDNQADRRGGGIYAEYIVLQLEGGTVISNNRASIGGGVCVMGYKSKDAMGMDVLHGVIKYGGVSIGGNTASETGGGVYRNGATRLGNDGPGGVQWFGNPLNNETVVNPP